MLPEGEDADHAICKECRSDRNEDLFKKALDRLSADQKTAKYANKMNIDVYALDIFKRQTGVQEMLKEVSIYICIDLGSKPMSLSPNRMVRMYTLRCVVSFARGTSMLSLCSLALLNPSSSLMIAKSRGD